MFEQLVLSARRGIADRNSAEVFKIIERQAVIKSRIRALKTEFNRLERRKRMLIKSIERAADRLQRVHGRLVPEAIIHKVEQRINQERWMEKIIEARFRSQSIHGPGSRKWKKISSKYRSWKAKHGLSTRINVATGVLKEATIAAVAGTYLFERHIRWNWPMIPVDYAVHVQAERPFILEPNEKEMKRVNARALRLIDIEYRSAMKGAS